MKKQSKLLVVFWLMTLAFSAISQRRLDLSNYELVWGDEFNYDNITEMLKPSVKNNWRPKWFPYLLTPDSVHYSLYGNSTWHGKYSTKTLTVLPDGYVSLKPEYLVTPEAVTYDTVTQDVHHRSSALASNFDGDYWCAWQSDPPIAVDGFLYGIFEIRAKLPNALGDYAAFWFWNYEGKNGDGSTCTPDNSGVVYCTDPNPANNNAPRCTGNCGNLEIDVFEAHRSNWQSGNPYNYWASIQANGHSANPDISCLGCATYYNWNGTKPWETFHTYTIAWTPNSMTWYIDGVEIRTQNTAVPPYKMKLFLTNISTNDDAHTSDPFVIDYVRVYRPKDGVTYSTHPNSAPAVYGQYVEGTDAYPFGGGSSNPQFAGANYTNYLTAWSNSPYHQDNNYSSLKRVTTGLKSTGVPIEKSGKMLSSVIDERNGQNILYYLDEIDGLCMITDFQQTNPFNTNSNWKGKKTQIANVGYIMQGSKLVLDPANGNLFWTGGDGKIYVRYRYNNVYSIGVLGTATDATKEIAFTNAVDNTNGGLPDEFHGGRLYYVNTSNVLCYYEWLGTTWSTSQTTNVNNVKDNLVISKVPNGKLFYRGTDNHIWTIWKYWGSPTSWSFAVLVQPYDNLNADCAGGIQITANANKIFYKKAISSTANEIMYWDMTTSPSTKKSTGIMDVWSDSELKLRTTNDGRTEVYYVSTSQKLRSYYERLSAYEYNSNTNKIKDWLNTTLSIFGEDIPSTSAPTDCGANCSNVLPHFSISNSTTTTPIVICQKTGGQATTTNASGQQISYTTYPIQITKFVPQSMVAMSNSLAACATSTTPNISIEAKGMNNNITQVKGEPKQDKREVKVFPNPNLGKFTVLLPAQKAFEVTLLDMTGRVVLTLSKQESRVEINMNSLSKGVYILQAKNEEEQYTQKVVYQ